MEVTDVHVHAVPPGLVERARGGLSGAVVSDAGELVLDGTEVGLAALYDARQLQRSLDERGVDVGCVSIPPPLYRQTLSAGPARIWTQAVNDALGELARASGGRLRSLAHLPIEHPGIALSEARARDGRDWVGFAIASHAPRVGLADPELRPLWEALDERGGFVFVHPGTPEDERLVRWYLTNLLGNPYETGLAAAELVFGDVLVSFGRIRFCLAHAGGVTAALAGRWQRGFDTQRPGLPLEHAPRTLLRKLYVDCVAFSDLYLELAAEVFGAEHVLLGSDWPFPMGALSVRRAPSFGANATRALA